MIPVALGALDKVDFALFAVIAQLMVAIKLAELGVQSACSRLLIDARAAGNEKYNKVWMASVFVFCSQAVLMLLLIFVLTPFLDKIFHLEEGQADLAKSIFLITGIINSAGYMLSIFSTALYAGQKLSHVNVVSSIVAVVQLMIFIIAIKLGAHLWSYPISTFAVVTVSNVILYRKTIRYQLLGRFDLSLLEWKEVKSVFVLGMDVFVAAMFSVVMGNSLLLFSGHLLTLEQTAILAVNLKLVNMMTNILQRIPGSASPMLMKMVSEGNDDQFRTWWRSITKITITMAMLMAGMFVFWNNWVVSVWTSDKMVISGWSLILLSLIPFRYLTHYQFVNSLTIYKEIRKVKWMLVWEVVLYGTLALILGRAYGLVGLLSANLLSMSGGALYSGMKYFSLYSQIAYRELINLLLKSVIPFTALFYVIHIGADLLGPKGIISIILTSVVWLLMAVVIIYFVVLHADERSKLWQLATSLKNKFTV
jgi:O-antigen/teichoic acid export membrane protein